MGVGADPLVSRRMLKRAYSYPPNLVRAETRTFPGFVLGLKKSSTYPRGYASGFFSPAASLDDGFAHPRTSITDDRAANDGIMETTND